MSQCVLEARGLLVKYGLSIALSVPYLSLLKNETLALIGPNGAGKSTLMRVLGLLEEPSQGEVYFLGRRVYWNSELLHLRRRMASAFQDPLLCDTTVFENVALGLRLRGLDKREIVKRVECWLERLEISGLAYRRARTLSGGEAQRVSLARAFVLEPEVLLLDEPFAALDPPARESLLLDLGAILREVRVATLFVSHDRTEAIRLGDRVGVMIGGKILQLDLPERVFSSPASEEVARFVGMETILVGKAISQEGEKGIIEVGETRLEVRGKYRPGEKVLVCIRPEDITISKREGFNPVTGGRNRIIGQIKRVVPLGPQFRVEMNCNFPVVALITKQSWEELSLKEGSEAVASFKPTAPHVLRKE